MPLLVWSEAYELDHGIMDTTHREFADLVNRAGEAADADFLPLFDELIAHTDAHFMQENRWMHESGFPPIHCHIGEHERVLDALRNVRQMVVKGDLPIGRTAVAEMVPWFANHAATMDAALNFHMKRSEYTPLPDAEPASSAAIA